MTAPPHRVPCEPNLSHLAADASDAVPSVLVVEDDANVRMALVAQLETAGMSVAGATGSASEACVMLAERPSIVLVDLGLPDGHGRDVIAAARELAVPALVLTVHADDACVFGAIRAGAAGYCLKSEAWARIEESVRIVLAGGAPISPSIARRLLESFRGEGVSNPHGEPGSPPAGAVRAPLTERERELMDLFAAGCTYAEAARIVGISINTVRHHVRGLYEKLHVNSKAEAVALLYRSR